MRVNKKYVLGVAVVAILLVLVSLFVEVRPPACYMDGAGRIVISKGFL